MYRARVRPGQSRLPLQVFVAALILAVLSACSATSSPPALDASSPPGVDASSPPWLLRHTFPGWDGKPVEVLGAPGPRAVATFLSLAMRRAQVSQPQELGDVLLELPSFYSYRRTPASTSSADSPAVWHVRSEHFAPLEWEGDETALLAYWHPEQILEQLSLRDLALAVSDVVWKWPRFPGSRIFLRPPVRPASIGAYCAGLLREKLDRGMPLERAWQELQFQMFDDSYVLTLLPNGWLRVSPHPEMDPADWTPPSPWEGKY